MLYVPRHLPNRLEYKVLSCISVHYQSRMASNEIAITPSRLHSAGRAMVLFKVAGWVLLLGDLRSRRYFCELRGAVRDGGGGGVVGLSFMTGQL